VHPFEDEQYLKEHPEAREKAALDKPVYSAPATPPVASPPVTSPSIASTSDRNSYVGTPNSKPEKKGLLGKLKDKTLGTKEEREMQKRHKAEEKRQMLEVSILLPFMLLSSVRTLVLAAAGTQTPGAPRTAGGYVSAAAATDVPATAIPTAVWAASTIWRVWWWPTVRRVPTAATAVSSGLDSLLGRD
jgi:hypothetical protein